MERYTTYLLLLVTGLGTVSAQPSVTVTGNETPLVVGIPRDLVCTANNINVASIEWKIVIAGFEPTLLASNTDELVIQPQPFQIGMQMYKCVVVSTTGERYAVDAPLDVQQLMHTVEVTSSSSSAVPAGGVVTLTCEVVSNVPAKLSWTGPSGPVSSGAGVSVITNEVDQQTTQSILAFHPLRVSHAPHTRQHILHNIHSYSKWQL